MANVELDTKVKDKKNFEKEIHYWCNCPPVYDKDGEQLFHILASSKNEKDESFNPSLGKCDKCDADFLGKKLVKKEIDEIKKIAKKETVNL